ncbi:MAG: hypothetical protein AB7E60_13055 [Sphingobium sp.]
MISRRLLTSLALLLSGCAGAPTTYPSLAKRPIENATVAEVAAAPTPVPADTELLARLATLSNQVSAGSAQFDRAYAAADRAARTAAGSPVASDAWVAAQLALSALEAARNDSVSALASLDVLYVDRVNTVAQDVTLGGLEEIDAARSAALAAVDSQNDRVDALRARLAQP